MSVYVGPLFPSETNPQWRYTQAAHLYADSDEELVVFAGKIGLKRARHPTEARIGNRGMNRYAASKERPRR